MGNSGRREYRYIWSIPWKNAHFQLSERISPYMEINEDFLNGTIEGEPEKMKINVNPFIRFNHIFANFLNVYDEIHITDIFERLKGEIFKKGIGYLRKLDFIGGTTVADICCGQILKEIGEGALGSEISKYMEKLAEDEKNIVALLYYLSIVAGKEGFQIFGEGIRKFFPDYVIYRDKYRKSKIIVYINSIKNENNRAKVKVLENLFLPVGVRVRYCWQDHFGVTEVEKTLRLGEMAVY